MDDMRVEMVMGFAPSSIIHHEEQVITDVQTMSGDEEAESIIALSTTSLHGCGSFYS